jgi:acetyl-CoA carboxylase carboxyl transferase subunit beta
MTWFKKGEEEKEGKEKREELKASDQLWVKCNSCNEIIYRKVIEQNLQVCPKCNYHFQIPARRRIECVADSGTFIEYDANLVSADPLEFKDSKRYPSRLRESQDKTGQKDAIVCGEATIKGQPAMIGMFEFNFMGGSLGSVVGEKITRLIERAIEKRIGVIIFCASGGRGCRIYPRPCRWPNQCRLGETSRGENSYISVLTDPTTGGFHSIAMLGDVTAEPKAMTVCRAQGD